MTPREIGIIVSSSADQLDQAGGKDAGVDQGRADESDQDPRESDIAEKQADKDQADGKDTGPPEELKIVLAIKDGRTTIGVQRPSSDPYIEVFDDPPTCLGVITRGLGRGRKGRRAKWEAAVPTQVSDPRATQAPPAEHVGAQREADGPALKESTARSERRPNQQPRDARGCSRG